MGHNESEGERKHLSNLGSIGSPNEIKRHLLLGRKVMTNLLAYSKAETLFCQQRSI